MVYTPTNWTNLSNPAQLLAVANTNTGGYFWTGMNMMVFLVALISMIAIVSWEQALLASAFLGLLISLVLTYAGLTGYWVMGTFVGIILLTIMYIIWSNKYD